MKVRLIFIVWTEINHHLRAVVGPVRATDQQLSRFCSHVSLVELRKSINSISGVTIWKIFCLASFYICWWSEGWPGKISKDSNLNRLHFLASSPISLHSSSRNGGKTNLRVLPALLTQFQVESNRKQNFWVTPQRWVQKPLVLPPIFVAIFVHIIWRYLIWMEDLQLKTLDAEAVFCWRRLFWLDVMKRKG